jgi:hypothetical protein
MNILLLTADDGRTGISLCTTRGETYCALEGEIVAAAGGAADIVLRDAGGAQLHQARFPLFMLPGADHTAGVLHVLAWLRERNIRVDLVAHRIALEAGQDRMQRLAPDRGATLAKFETRKPTAYCIEAVASTVDLPQVAYFAVASRTDLGIARAIAAAGLQAPTGCPKKLKVRCESCCAN